MPLSNQPAYAAAIASKLPHVGDSIFSVMSARAREHGALNLSQGFPDFMPDRRLIELVHEHMLRGNNQYAPMAGLPALRQEIAKQTEQHYGLSVNPETEVTVTSGATEALFAALSAIVQPEDEIILFDPAYDAYAPVIELHGGVPVRIPLSFPEYRIDWNLVARHITRKTRAIILNAPHNPTGTLLEAADLEALKDLTRSNDIFIVSDEVYEHIVFDRAEHMSLLRDAELARRSFVISSFGKSLHVTGWKIGFCIAPPALTAELRKLHQYITFATSTPMQAAIADYIREKPAFGSELRQFYQAKRDLFANLMAGSRFKPLSCRGTYFQLYDYSAIQPGMSDTDFANWLTDKHGVACIPVSVFYQHPEDHSVVRFCFAKDDDTLRQAADILCKI